MGLEYVDGDDFVESRKHELVDSLRTVRWMSWAFSGAFLTTACLYGLFGGRGWLAIALIMAVFTLGIAIYDFGHRILWALSASEHRLRILEDRTYDQSQALDAVERKLTQSPDF